MYYTVYKATKWIKAVKTPKNKIALRALAIQLAPFITAIAMILVSANNGVQLWQNLNLDNHFPKVKKPLFDNLEQFRRNDNEKQKYLFD